MSDSLDFEECLCLLEDELHNTDFAKDMYRALCNMQWRRIDNPSDVYSCSWRHAGRLIAEIRDLGEDYMDFYCCGDEGYVSHDVEEELKELGWECFPYDEEGKREEADASWEDEP